MSWLKLEVILFMASYASIIGVFLIGRKRAKQKEKKSEKHQDAQEISVVIPFRNESENLPNLLESFQKFTVRPKEFIFVNDHSEDDFSKHFSSFELPHRIVKLEDDIKGKKAAIHLGVKTAETEFVLTWDADIVVPPNYFKELVKWNWTDLNILPVYMHGPEFIPGFFAMDYQLQAQANVALNGFLRPITASGANLLFSKKTFLTVAPERNDELVPSGDDQFLLKAMRLSNNKVNVLTDLDLRVKTKAPQSISEGMIQRGRWLGKTSKVNDSFASVFGLVVFLIQMTYYGFAWYQTVLGDWGATIVMVLIKGELDAFLTTYKFQEQFNTLKVFIYELVYPVYIIALLVYTFALKNEWKGRPS